MDTSCCSLSVKVVFQNSSRLGNKPRCKVPFNQDTAFPSFTAISSDKASFLPNAQYQSLACAASLLTIQTQQENTFARASEHLTIYTNQDTILGRFLIPRSFKWGYPALIVS